MKRNWKSSEGIHEFLNQFKPTPPTKHLNIMLFGPSNAGKSSLINNVMYNDDNAETFIYAEARPESQQNASGQYTKCFTRYDVNKYVRIYDLFGWNVGNNFKKGEFLNILKGRFPLNQRDGEEYKLSRESDETIIDVVIFVFDSLDLANRTKHLEQLRPFLLICKERNVPFLFVITKIDAYFDDEDKVGKAITLKGESGERAEQLVSISKEWRTLKRLIEHSTKEDTLSILPMINEESDAYIRSDVCQHFARRFVQILIRKFEEFERKKNNDKPHHENRYHLKLFREEEDENQVICIEFRDTKKQDPLKEEEVYGLASMTNHYPINDVCILKDFFTRILSFSFRDKQQKKKKEMKYRFYISDVLLFHKEEEEEEEEEMREKEPISFVFGVYNEELNEVFQGISKDFSFLEEIKKLLNDTETKLCYHFLNGRNYASTHFDSRKTHHFFLKCGNLSMMMKRKQYSNFECLIENNIQLMKTKVKKETKKIKEQYQFHFEYIEKKRIKREEFEKNKASKVLSYEQNKEMEKRIQNFELTKEKLLYRGSEHSFSAAAFHAACDRKGPNYVLVKTTKGKVFGGYLNTSWDSNNSWSNSSGSFLFGFTSNGRFIRFNYERNNTFWGHSSYGPIFGNGHDLHIRNNCNSNNESYTCLGSSYPDKELGAYFLNGGEKNFTVKEYEVFRI